MFMARWYVPVWIQMAKNFKIQSNLVAKRLLIDAFVLGLQIFLKDIVVCPRTTAE